MDCSLAGSPVHGISQARILKWVIIYFSRGSSQTRDLAQVSWIVRWILYQLEYPNHYGCRKEDHCLFQNFFVLFLYLPKSNRASLVAQLVKNPPTMWETWIRSLGWKIPLRSKWLPTPVFWPGEFHELYSPWFHKELDMTERLSLFSLSNQIAFPIHKNREFQQHCVVGKILFTHIFRFFLSVKY